MHIIKEVFLLLSTLRLLPHIVLFYFLKDKENIVYDIKTWSRVFYKVDNAENSIYRYFIVLMTFRQPFRNLFYSRIRKRHPLISFLLKPLCPSMPSLYIPIENVGKGLIIQHGFSTIIAAKSIGDYCWINQQVTIGFSNNEDAPVIGNKVKVHAGAKVIGGITIGDNVTIGANAVVVKDVPSNCTVVGVPAYIIKKDGKSVKKPL